jgi:DNA-directed RNA polymerase specialized sigma24 family protein
MTPTAPGPRRTRTYEIVDALNQDWCRLSAEDQTTAARWAETHAALAGCRSLDEVLTAVARRPDDALHALLTVHERGESIAGRTVLQAMLGKVVRLAGRHPDASVDDYVAAVWCRICSYPLAKRPVKIAANIALDALKDIHLENSWTRQRIDVMCIEPGMVLDQLRTAQCAREENDHNSVMAMSTAISVINGGDRLGLFNPETRDVLLSVYSDGLSGHAAADRHRTSSAMIRFRCRKGVHQLALHADQLLEAA